MGSPEFAGQADHLARTVWEDDVSFFVVSRRHQRLSAGASAAASYGEQGVWCQRISHIRGAPGGWLTAGRRERYRPSELLQKKRKSKTR